MFFFFFYIELFIFFIFFFLIFSCRFKNKIKSRSCCSPWSNKFWWPSVWVGRCPILWTVVYCRRDSTGTGPGLSWPNWRSTSIPCSPSRWNAKINSKTNNRKNYCSHKRTNWTFDEHADGQHKAYLTTKWTRR